MSWPYTYPNAQYAPVPATGFSPNNPFVQQQPPSPSPGPGAVQNAYQTSWNAAVVPPPQYTLPRELNLYGMNHASPSAVTAASQQHSQLQQPPQQNQQHVVRQQLSTPAAQLGMPWVVASQPQQHFFAPQAPAATSPPPVLPHYAPPYAPAYAPSSPHLQQHPQPQTAPWLQVSLGVGAAVPLSMSASVPQPQQVLESAPEPEVDASALFRPGKGKVLVLMRGLPGSGKSYTARIIAAMEEKASGSPARIVGMHHYLTQDDEDEEYEADASELRLAAEASALRACERLLASKLDRVVIVDDVHARVRDFEPYVCAASAVGAEVVVCEVISALSAQELAQRSSRAATTTAAQIAAMKRSWEPTPPHLRRLNVATLTSTHAFAQEAREVDMGDEDAVVHVSTDDARAQRENAIRAFLERTHAHSASEQSVSQQQSSSSVATTSMTTSRRSDNDKSSEDEMRDNVDVSEEEEVMRRGVKRKHWQLGAVAEAQEQEQVEARAHAATPASRDKDKEKLKEKTKVSSPASWLRMLPPKPILRHRKTETSTEPNSLAALLSAYGDAEGDGVVEPVRKRVRFSAEVEEQLLQRERVRGTTAAVSSRSRYARLKAFIDRFDKSVTTEVDDFEAVETKSARRMEGERERSKDRERDPGADHERVREKDLPSERARDRDRRDRDESRYRDRDTDRDRDKERDRERDRDRERNRERYKGRDRDHERQRDRDRDKVVERDKDKYGRSHEKEERTDRRR